MTKGKVLTYFNDCGYKVKKSDFLVASDGTMEVKIPDIPETFQRKPFKLAMKMARDATLKGYLFYDNRFTYSGDPDYKLEAMVVFLKMYEKIRVYF